jgi:Uma2 family endonuclease
VAEAPPGRYAGAMRQTASRRHHTYAEYLALEEVSNTKHEYLDGEILAMAGGTPEHAELSAAIIASLHRQLRTGCRVFSSDLRVRVSATGLATYPDVTVVCGPLERDPDGPATILNPALIVEVLSDSTEEYDRGEKLAHYQRVPSLQGIVYASQREPRLELWLRAGEAWVQQTAGGGDTLELPSVGARLAVDELYAGLLG